MRSESSTPGIDALLGICRRRWWIGVLAFVAPFATAVALIESLPNTYRSSATILVEHQQVPEAFVKSTVTGAVETRLHTISQEVLSRSRLAGLINRFGLYPTLRATLPSELLIERMRKDIEFELRSSPARGGSPTTVAFAISFRGSDPETVAEITNTLASFYIEENLKARERQASGTSQFLKAQLEETKKVLDNQEDRLTRYKRRYLGELPHQMGANLTSLEQLGTQLRINSDQQTRALWRRDALAVQLTDAQRVTAARAATTSAAGDPPVATAAPLPRVPTPGTTRLQRLREQLTEFRTKYSDKYPEVIRLKAEIAAVERETLSEEPAATPAATTAGDASRAPRSVDPVRSVDPLISQLQANLGEANAEIQALKQDEARLRAAYSTYQRRVENTPSREQEFEELSRGHQTTQEHYQSLLKRYEEAQLAEDMEQRQKGEQFRILDPAMAAQEPTAPNRLRLFLLSLVLCAGLALGGVVLVERLDTSFHTLDDLRAFTTVPVLVSVSRIVTPGDLRGRRRRAQLAIVASLLGLTVLVAVGHFVAHGNERLVWILSRGRS